MFRKKLKILPLFSSMKTVRFQKVYVVIDKYVGKQLVSSGIRWEILLIKTNVVHSISVFFKLYRYLHFKKSQAAQTISYVKMATIHSFFSG